MSPTIHGISPSWTPGPSNDSRLQLKLCQRAMRSRWGQLWGLREITVSWFLVGVAVVVVIFCLGVVTMVCKIMYCNGSSVVGSLLCFSATSTLCWSWTWNVMMFEWSNDASVLLSYLTCFWPRCRQSTVPKAMVFAAKNVTSTAARSVTCTTARKQSFARKGTCWSLWVWAQTLIGFVQMQAPRLDACVRTSPKVWLDFARILVSVSWFYLHCLCSNFLLWILWSKKCQLLRLQRVQLRILWLLPTGTKGRNCYACYARSCSESCGLLKLRTCQRSRKWVMDDMDDSFNDRQGV